MMRFGFRFRAVAAAAAVLLVTAGAAVAGAVAASATTGGHEYPAVHMTRLNGADRYATSVAVASGSSAGAPATGGTVVLATGASWSDAVAAAPAAAALGAPVLVTAATSLPSSVAHELTALAPKRIVLLGSTSTISAGVQSATHTAAPAAAITRLSGADRYATARAIVTWAETNAPAPFAAGVFIASGGSFSDAASAAAAAGAQNQPLIYAPAGAKTLDASTTTLIRAVHATHATLVGGTGSVSAGIQTQVAALVGGTSHVSRVAGSDGYATSAAVARTVHGSTTAYLASGSSASDALAGVAAAARAKSPLLTVKTACVPAPVATYVHATTTSAYLLGSTADIASTVPALVQCSTASYTVKSSSTVGAVATNGGSPSIGLSAVACPTSTRCVAVGSRTGRPIAAVENSGHWTVTSLPLPTGYTAPGSLTAVSCASATRCVAVGGFGKSERGLVEMYNGSTWKASRISAPTGAPADTRIHLTAVSCAGTSCAITGEYTAYKTNLIESLAIDVRNSTVTTRVVAGRNDLTLASCAASLSCEAGGIDYASGIGPIVGDPHTGHFADAAAPASASGGFDGLVCSSPGECTGWTGYSNGFGVPNAGAILKLEGGIWTTDSIVPFAGTMSAFGARQLACATIDFCAVAFDASANNGSTWTPELAVSGNHKAISARAPLPSGVTASMHPDIWKIVCPRTGTCIAVGTYQASRTDTRMFVDVLSNGVWTAHALPTPSGQKWVGIDPSGISCPTTSTCHVVGSENYIRTANDTAYAAGFDDVITF